MAVARLCSVADKCDEFALFRGLPGSHDIAADQTRTIVPATGRQSDAELCQGRPRVAFGARMQNRAPTLRSAPAERCRLLQRTRPARSVPPSPARSAFSQRLAS